MTASNFWFRYHGVIAAHASVRCEVVPEPGDNENKTRQLDLWKDHPPEPKPKRTPWAKLLARVFQVDVSVCPDCQGHKKIKEFLDAEAAAEHSRAQPRIASAPPQLYLPFAG